MRASNSDESVGDRSGVPVCRPMAARAAPVVTRQYHREPTGYRMTKEDWRALYGLFQMARRVCLYGVDSRSFQVGDQVGFGTIVHVWPDSVVVRLSHTPLPSPAAPARERTSRCDCERCTAPVEVDPHAY